MSKVIGHGIKNWNCSYVPGIFLVEAVHLELFETVICYVISLGNSKHPFQHCLFLGREVQLPVVNADLVNYRKCSLVNPESTGFFEKTLYWALWTTTLCEHPLARLITQMMSSLSALLSWSGFFVAGGIVVSKKALNFNGWWNNTLNTFGKHAIISRMTLRLQSSDVCVGANTRCTPICARREGELACPCLLPHRWFSLLKGWSWIHLSTVTLSSFWVPMNRCVAVWQWMQTFELKKQHACWISLVVQWSGLPAHSVGVTDPIPGCLMVWPKTLKK